MISKESSGISRLYRVGPGVGLLLILGLSSRGLASLLPWVHQLLVAIGLGFLVANTVGVPTWAEDGVGTHSLFLEVGIVLMGATIGVGQLIEVSTSILLVLGITVCGMILLVEFLARQCFEIPEKLGSLLAAGSGICGVSAVIAVAGSIKPEKQQTAYAAATVVLFDTVTLIIYPVVGRVLDLPDIVFGIWAGTTMFSTGPVTAAGFVYSQQAGEWAILVKLARNALIGVVAIGYALYYNRHGVLDTPAKSRWRFLWATFPKFIIGFIGMMFLGSLGVFSSGQLEMLNTTSSWLFLLAFAGLGINIKTRDLRITGIQPVFAVVTSLVIMSTLSLIILYFTL